MFFRIGKNEYCYYLALKNDEVISESLYRKAVTGKKTAMIFEREADSISLGYTINKKSLNTSINPKCRICPSWPLTMTFRSSARL